MIDGQQRLKSLQFFCAGVFNPKEGESKQRVFRLTDVQEPFKNKTFNELPDEHRGQLESSVIHVTIVKQDAPKDDDTSIYHIFERLNAGGRRLAPQEIRTAASHGPLIELLERLNKQVSWRAIYGKPSPRLKDEELILRFFALMENLSGYERPMNEFLNRFAKKHTAISQSDADAWTTKFNAAITLIHEAVGVKAFRPERSLNAAVFDAVMVGVATTLTKRPITKPEALKTAYETLLTDPEFIAPTSRATADEKSVNDRLKLAIKAFSNLA